jgi:hypothetical protein
MVAALLLAPAFTTKSALAFCFSLKVTDAAGTLSASGLLLFLKEQPTIRN